MESGDRCSPVAPWDSPRARERCLREARRYTRCTADAEDVVQEAMLRAWRMRAQLRDTADPMPWLLRITRNEALRALDRARRERARAELIAAAEVAAPGDDWRERVTTRLDVQEAVGRLRQDDRILLSLRYNSELTHSEIAEAVGVPVGTCKVRLHRLRERLAFSLPQEGTA